MPESLEQCVSEISSLRALLESELTPEAIARNPESYREGWAHFFGQRKTSRLLEAGDLAEEEAENHAEERWLFGVWYLCHWVSMRGGSAEKETILQQRLRQPDWCSARLRPCLESLLRTPLDFYQFHRFSAVEPVYAKSLFLGFESSFLIDPLPEGLDLEAVYLAQILPVSEDRGLVLSASRPFPLTAKVEISRLKRQLVRPRRQDYHQKFYLFDADIFDLYNALMTETYG